MNRRTIISVADAVAALAEAWQLIITECREVLGGELHYQNMVYHALRSAGVPHTQLGMNVRQMVRDPVSDLFKSLNERKHPAYRSGFETVPDAVIFSEAVQADWRRRSAEWSLSHMLLAIEIKASERHRSRLSSAEICRDIAKLDAHRQETSVRGHAEFCPVMMVIDVAHDPIERMRPRDLDKCRAFARASRVSWLYLNQDHHEAIYQA